MYTILGAGLAGLSASYHIGHDKCMLYEKNNYATGHIHSEFIDGFTWDEGPHVSFTDIAYVKEFFEKSTEDNLLEYPVSTVNYYKGTWIPHPAQTNLFAVSQPLRDLCFEDFLKARANFEDDFKPANYKEWLDYSFGETFSDTFPAAYTRKYWTVEPEALTTDWVGNRVFYPNVDQVKEGFNSPLKQQIHYIKKIRYPRTGGYMAFASKLLPNANLILKHELQSIDFENRKIKFTNGTETTYQKLINTIPLPLLIEKSNAPAKIKNAAAQLNCSSVLLVNVTASHITARPENWIYVYDEDKYSTRINCTELLSSLNAPEGTTGVQVEVYFSAYKNKAQSNEAIVEKVIDELIEMGLIKSKENITGFHTKWVQWGNVIFDRQRKENQDIVLNWLTTYGLVRENDDLEPMTNWQNKTNEDIKLGDLILAGRFGQWKYYWTDDCIMRGKIIGEKI